MIMAHSESVGAGAAPGGSPPAPTNDTPKPAAVPPEHAVTALVSMVTVPFRARARPWSVALVPRVMLVSARTFPCIALKVPIAAELPICHQMSQGVAPLMRLTLDAAGPDAVVRAVAWIT